MGFFEDAQAFMQSKQHTDEQPKDWNPQDEKTREALFKECRELYDNATKQEIERAIDRVLEALEPPYDKAIFMKKLRIYLED